MEAEGLHPIRGVNQEAAFDHSGEGSLSTRICTVDGGDLVGAMVGSRRGK